MRSCDRKWIGMACVVSGLLCRVGAVDAQSPNRSASGGLSVESVLGDAALERSLADAVRQLRGDEPRRVEKTGASGGILLQDDFSTRQQGWQGTVSSIETAGCTHPGSGRSGLHFGYEPGGPLYRDVAGFIPGRYYTLSFEVKTLDPRDAGLVRLALDDAPMYMIVRNGPVTLRFQSARPVHRIRFDWANRAIMWAPIHIENMKISPAD